MSMAREASSVIDNSVTVTLPQLSGIAHGEDHEPIVLKGTREDLMKLLPADVPITSHVYSGEVIGKSARGSLIIANNVELHDAEGCIIVTNKAHIVRP